MGAARVSGGGSVEVTGAAVVVEGRILGAESPIPSWASLVVLGVGVLVSVLVPHAERILTPATVVAVAAILWFRYRAEFGLGGVFRVPWSDIEHVVRMPSAPDVVAIVLARPLAGAGTPEQFFFAPAGGVDPFVAALQRSAPAHLGWDLQSAAHAHPEPEGADEDQ